MDFGSETAGHRFGLVCFPWDCRRKRGGGGGEALWIFGEPRGEGLTLEVPPVLDTSNFSVAQTESTF